MTRAGRLPTARALVSRVLTIIADIEMCNADAGTVVATMQHLFPFRYGTVCKCPGETMSAIVCCLAADAHREVSVTALGKGTKPKKTAGHRLGDHEPIEAFPNRHPVSHQKPPPGPCPEGVAFC